LLSMFEQLHEWLENSIKNDSTNELMSPKHLGHLIPLNCGHTGQLMSEEANLMEKHLKEAGFIQLKDEPLQLNNKI
jgi:hypothetical protein